MKIEYYENFEKELEAGLKKQAATSVRLFIDSFKGEDEIQEWVWSYLPKLEKNRHGCIRHELFISLITAVPLRVNEEGLKTSLF
jgi:hypothetical protein